MIISNFRRVIQQEPGVYRLGLLSSSSLYMDFAGGFGVTLGVPSSATSLLTTTRASDGYSDDTAGNYTLFGSGVPRITNKGLLVEGARTNSIRNNSMQGAAPTSTLPTNWGGGGGVGLTVGVVGTGTENGVDYIDLRWSGTSDSTFATMFFDAITAIAATNGQNWTESVFVSLVGGSFANVSAVQLSARQYDAVSGVLSDVNGTSFFSSITATQTRFVSSLATNNASTAFFRPFIIMSYSNAAAIDFTLRIGWPQLELGAFVTSPIRTTSAAATRAADVVTVNNFGTWFNASTGSLFTEVNAPTVQGIQTFASIDDGTANERFTIRAASGSPAGLIVDGGATQASMTSSGWSAGVTTKSSLAYAANDGAFRTDGGTVGTDASVTLPTVDRLLLGSRATSTADLLCGYLRRVAYFPTRLTNAQLQAMTR